MLVLYGFDRSYPEQFFIWLSRAVQGDLGTSIATGRAVSAEVFKAVGNTLMLAAVATAIGFFFGCLFGFVAGYFRDSFIDKAASILSVLGVSVPHYWLGMVMVIIFSAHLGWLPATGAGPGGSADWVSDWAHVQHLILPAITCRSSPWASSRAPCGRWSPRSLRRNSSSACAPRGSAISACSAMW
jgi:peptide/nickel transport system permease protein